MRRLSAAAHHMKTVQDSSCDTATTLCFSAHHLICTLHKRTSRHVVADGSACEACISDGGFCSMFAMAYLNWTIRERKMPSKQPHLQPCESAFSCSVIPCFMSVGSTLRGHDAVNISVRPAILSDTCRIILMARMQRL
jgi:hypothetical protein